MIYKCVILNIISYLLLLSYLTEPNLNFKSENIISAVLLFVVFALAAKRIY